MSREAMLMGAMRYLEREGSMSAAHLGTFATGDASLYARLDQGEPLRPGEYDEAAPFILGMLDRVVEKLTAERARMIEAMSGPVLRCAA